MHWTFLALAGLALAGVHLLRVPQRSSRFGAVSLFLLGLILSAASIRLLLNANGIGRETDFDAFVNHGVAVANKTDKPILLFSGASFSRNAIDANQLTQKLNARGYNYQVVSLSLEAASLMERDIHIRQYLKQAPAPPEVIFIETAFVTDTRPTFIFGNSKFSDRAIEQFTPGATVWAATGLVDGGCQSLTDCTKESIFLVLHGVLNAANIGLASQGMIERDVPPRPAFDPTQTPREEIDFAIEAEAMKTLTATPPADVPVWATSHRHLQRQYLESVGVATVGYYFPPVIAADLRAYAEHLCASELSGLLCIHPNDADLMSALIGKDYWLDREHLLQAGSDIYTDWLMEKLIASGVLEAGE